MGDEGKTALVHYLRNRALLAVGFDDVVDALERTDEDLSMVEVADVLRRVHEWVQA